jgi:NDP-sugar pyrophosphorylase family protein
MEVILLAAGMGERMRPLSLFYPKSVLPIAGKPILTRLIEVFKELGCTKFIIVKGAQGAAIERAAAMVSGIEVRYAVQEPPKGMGDALRCIREQVSPLPEEFILSATDVLYDLSGIKAMIDNHKHSRANATLSLVKSLDKRFARGHGNVAVNEKLGITKIVEKPGEAHALSDYYSLPTYIFHADIFSVLDQIPPSVRGEIELQDAIETLIESGKKILGVSVIPEQKTLDSIGKYHITTISDFFLMNMANLKGMNLPDLEEYPTTIEPIYIDSGVTVKENCFIGPQAYIRGPSTLEEGVEVSEIVIFENSNIGRRSKLQKCVVLPGSKVPPNAKLSEVIITQNGNIPLGEKIK